MGSPNVPQAPNYSNFGQANSQFGQGLNGLYGYAGQGNQYVQGITNNPYAGGYQQAAGQAGGQYGALGGLASGASGSLYGAGNQALSAGSAILQAGFDPQSALYNRTQNQVQQQTLAGLAATGTASSPYGAGVLGQTNSNFNIDWQDNELVREATAANAYGGLSNTAQSDFAAGGQQGVLGAQSTLQAGALPYNTKNQINQNSLDALSVGQGLYSSANQSAGQYLGLANQGYGNQLAAEQQQNQQNQQLWSGLGQIGGNLFSGFGLANGGLGSLFGFGGSTTQLGSSTLNPASYGSSQYGQLGTPVGYSG